MMFAPFEVEQTLRMFSEQNLDVRTITMGINLLDCVGFVTRGGTIPPPVTGFRN